MSVYSIADAKNRFTELVQEAERHSPVQITRRGRPVAVLLSISDYQRLQAGQSPFWSAYETFRGQHDLAALNIEPEQFDDARARETGRDVEL